MKEFVSWDDDIPNCFWKVIIHSMVPNHQADHHWYYHHPIIIPSSSHHHPIIISSLISLRSYITSTNQFVIIQTIGNSTRLIQHGSLNVPIEHHPTIRYMVYNGYYKVMSNIPKMGQLPTPVQSFQPCSLLRTIPQETQRDDVHLGDGSAKAHETVHQPGCNKWGISEMI